MIDISYDLIYRLSDDFFSTTLRLNGFTNALKVLALTFFLLNVYTNIFSRVGTSWGQAKLPFDQNKLLSSLVIVLGVVFYDKLLDFLDTLLLGFDNVYNQFSPFDFTPKDDDLTNNGDFDWKAKLKEMATESIKLMKDPSHILVLLVEGIAWMIDSAIYIVFLLERFFFIGLLKVLGGIAIVLAVFEKFRDLFYKWLKLYIAVYLLILPFFLVIGFTTSIFEFFDNAIGFNNPVNLLVGSKVRVMVLFIMIWLKLKLFKKSYDIVYKIFT